MPTGAQNQLDRIIDFEPLIRRSLQGFVGREWVRQRVAAFLAQPGPRNFLVLGKPGSGKTSVMVDLVRLYDCPHHFIGKGSQLDVEGSSEWRNPVRFAESLGYQLVRDFGGWVMPWDRFGIDVQQGVKVSNDNLDPVSAAAAHGRIADAYLPLDKARMGMRPCVTSLQRPSHPGRRKALPRPWTASTRKQCKPFNLTPTLGACIFSA